MTKISILIIVFCTVFSLTACKHDAVSEASETESVAEELFTAQSGSVATETWTSAGSSVCAWFSADEPEYSMGVNTDPMTIHAGKTKEGKLIFSLLRLPMRGTWFSNEIKNAKLYLKIASGDMPSTLSIGSIKELWSNSITTLADANDIIGKTSFRSVVVQQEQDGWISIDITSYIAEWLNGDIPNYGIAVLGENNGEQTAFYSDWDADSKHPPRLEVTGATLSRSFNYGKFQYIRHPENETDDALLEKNEVANCLSYALRDINAIGADDLDLDYDEMTRLCREFGEDAVAGYCAERISDYVERNKAGLKITGFRRIDDFDSEIDSEKEYRIALRVGCYLYDDEDVLDEVAGNFDFHLWAQINNGQWAQKFMFEPTEIVPCIPPGVSPAKYNWDASLSWGNDKFTDFYSSKIIYFAVSKDAEGFTEHNSRSLYSISD